jgi:hypothetical protein
MADPGALSVAVQVTRVLDDLGIPYVIGGSLASIAHGMMRTTMDVDIIADIQTKHVDEFYQALRKQFYLPDETILHEAIERRSSFNLIHLATMFKVDIFIPREREFDQQQLDRRLSEPASSESKERVWIMSPEDVILAKLDWYRTGGESSERQWRDVLGVLQAQKSFVDVPYLKKWARTLQVSDLLERALAEVGEDA